VRIDPVPRDVPGSPAVAPDGTIYFGWTEELTAIGPNGRRKWSLRPNGGVANGSPIVGPDGTIDLGTWDYLWAINPNGSTKWRFFPDGDGDFDWHSPAVGRDGAAYMGNGYCYDDRAVYAINIDGSLRWKFATDDPPGDKYFSGAPAIAPDGTVYIRRIDGVVFALNADGTERWRFQSEGLQFQLPALHCLVQHGETP
jgi:outer membrane protein assembly factor BamB